MEKLDNFVAYAFDQDNYWNPIYKQSDLDKEKVINKINEIIDFINNTNKWNETTQK